MKTAFDLFRAADRSPAVQAEAVRRYGPIQKWPHTMWQEFWGDWRAQAVPPVASAQLMSVVPSSFFQTPDWLAFANELKGVQEIVRWTLYAYKAYPAAGSVNLLLFDQSEGLATNGRLDTNMMDTGKLPGNEMFVGVGLGIDPIPAQADVFAVNAANGIAMQQWYNVLTLGFVEFRISGKEYLIIAPILRLPPGHGFAGTTFTAGAIAANLMNIALPVSGTPDNRAKYNIDPPVGILPTRPFEVRLRWNALQAVATAGRIGAAFDGWKIRAVL